MVVFSVAKSIKKEQKQTRRLFILDKLFFFFSGERNRCSEPTSGSADGSTTNVFKDPAAATAFRNILVNKYSYDPGTLGDYNTGVIPGYRNAFETLKVGSTLTVSTNTGGAIVSRLDTAIMVNHAGAPVVTTIPVAGAGTKRIDTIR